MSLELYVEVDVTSKTTKTAIEKIYTNNTLLVYSGYLNLIA